MRVSPVRYQSEKVLGPGGTLVATQALNARSITVSSVTNVLRLADPLCGLSRSRSPPSQLQGLSIGPHGTSNPGFGTGFAAAAAGTNTRVRARAQPTTRTVRSAGPHAARTPESMT